MSSLWILVPTRGKLFHVQRSSSKLIGHDAVLPTVSD